MEKLPRGVARRFWRKARRAQRPPEIQGKIFSQPCLLWTGGRDNKGYGVFRAFPGCMGLPSGLVRVHRLAYWLANGPFPRNAQVDHLCRHKDCLEVKHLRLLGISEHARVSRGFQDETILDEETEREIIHELEEF